MRVGSAVDSVLPEEVVIFLRHLRVVLLLGFIGVLPIYDMICVRCLDLLRGCYCYDLLAHCQNMIFHVLSGTSQLWTRWVC